jgi:hypothetical protein
VARDSSAQGRGATRVSFPEADGRRSSSSSARAIVADAAYAADPDLGERIASSSRWREQYATFLRELTALSADPARSLAIARAGLEAMHSRLLVDDGAKEIELGKALEDAPGEPALGTGEIHGEAQPVRRLEVPYRGATLHGQALVDQLERWVQAGSVEPSFAKALERVVAHPEWLALPGRRLALVGAGAEIGPLGPLCTWGADVLALDVPDAAVWQRIHTAVRGGAGMALVPVSTAGVAGIDVVEELSEARAWLAANLTTSTPVLGMYGYADGGAHVLLTAAFDALASDLLARDPAAALAYLATPTDAYVVPEHAVARAQAAYSKRRVRALLQAPAKLVSGGRLFRPSYRDGVPVADALVKQQGANYAVAKRLQRWRGVQVSAAGQRVSFNVAPASWTGSVTKNRILAAAYAGARHFGIEIFAPETTRVLMAALLVHDLHVDAGTEGNHERLFSVGAAHGGLWTAAYEPRSALGVAALAGLPVAALRGSAASPRA